jgi:hypothetical protein
VRPNGAEYESQGQARSASPLESNQKIFSPEKGVITSVFRPFRPWYCVLVVPGATRFALAPGFHIPRRWRFYHTRWRSVSTFEAKPAEIDLITWAFCDE